MAALGKGNVSPNPMVGAVIVHKEKIIGEGYHQYYGGPHAEVNAINAVQDKSLLKESTIYVSLEPCSHYGKTPPCADLIIENKIPRVVISSIDSNEVVCGNGITKLKNAGVEVITDILSDQSYYLNKTFNKAQTAKRPYIYLKWAETKDGFIDTNRNTDEIKALQISNRTSSIWVHKIRSEVDAILVGTRTIQLDNPQLTTRKWYGKSPIRIAIDRQLKTDQTRKIYDDSAPTLIFNLYKHGVENNIEWILLSNEEPTAQQIINVLYQRNIQALLVEGGAKTLQSFIDDALFDECIVIKGNNQIYTGVKSPQINRSLFSVFEIDDNNILHYEKND